MAPLGIRDQSQRHWHDVPDFRVRHVATCMTSGLPMAFLAVGNFGKRALFSAALSRACGHAAPDSRLCGAIP
jgi:hypothetical protein